MIPTSPLSINSLYVEAMAQSHTPPTHLGALGLSVVFYYSNLPLNILLYL